MSDVLIAGPVTSKRREVTSILEGADLLPVIPYVPGDLAEVPCLVVSATSLGPSRNELVVMETTTSVYVCGNRLNDQGSQDELDEFADRVIAVFGGTRGRDGLAVERAEPRLLQIAGQQVPAFEITIASHVVTCR